MGINIIADLAGEYDAFLRLLKKMPDDPVVSIGDMIDRGRKSKEVIEWFMKNGSAIKGNHEHMMLDYCRNAGYYDHGCWLWNGGGSTLHSFDGSIPEEVLQWVEKLPLHMEIEGCFVSHSFISPYETLEEAVEQGVGAWKRGESSILWNRRQPIRRDKFQIAGHNSQFGLRRFSDEQGDYAICIDDSRHRKITGIHLPSFEIFQEDCD